MDFHHKLPEPGGYVSSLPGPPCGCCGERIFDVVRKVRVAEAEDGTVLRLASVEVQCPSCAMLSDRKVVERRVIGSLNTRTGDLLLAKECEVAG